MPCLWGLDILGVMDTIRVRDPMGPGLIVQGLPGVPLKMNGIQGPLLDPLVQSKRGLLYLFAHARRACAAAGLHITAGKTIRQRAQIMLICLFLNLIF